MAVIAAVDVIKEEPEIRTRLLANAAFMRSGLESLGFDIGKTQTQIIPVVIGDEFLMCRFVAGLFDSGIAVNPVIYPAVKTGRAQLRICVTSLHSMSELSAALGKFRTVGRQLGII
jgi:glycine C-acetyltransferase